MDKIFWADSHFHPQYEPLNKDSIEEALLENITRLCAVGTRLSEINFLLSCKNDYNIKIALGEHPLDIPEQIDWEILEENIKNFSAIGETGFDYQGNLNDQLRIFNIQANLAIKYDLPLILHVRDSGNGIVEEYTINALKNFPNLKAVFHCFVGTEKLANFAISQNMFISFSGIITFKKCDELRKVLKTIPIELLLIETDSPWLAPVPFRGKTNYPVYVKYIGEYISSFLDIPIKEFSENILKNFDNLYNKG